MIFLDSNGVVNLRCDKCGKNVEALNRYDGSNIQLCADCMIGCMRLEIDTEEKEKVDGEQSSNEHTEE